MSIDERRAEQQQEDEMGGPMPGMSVEDSLTYDPTQGKGTPGWQLSVRDSMRRNAMERRN